MNTNWKLKPKIKIGNFILFLEMFTSYAVDKLMNTLPLRCTMDTIDSSDSAFPLCQFPWSMLQPFELIYFQRSISLEFHSKIFQVLRFFSISTTRMKLFSILVSSKRVNVSKIERTTHFNNCCNSSWYQNQKRSVFVDKVEKDYNLTKCSP